MTPQRITKRTVDGLQCNGREFTAWDDRVNSFGVRVLPDWREVLRCRLQGGLGAMVPPVRRYTISAVGKITPERARARAKVILGAVAHGQIQQTRNRRTRRAHGGRTSGPVHGRPCASQAQGRNGGVLPRHSGSHSEAGRGHHEGRQADPAPGRQVAFLACRHTFQANRVLAVVGSMYAFAGFAGIVPEGTNPARGIDKFKESRRERFLTGEELERLGSAIREAETTGIPWSVDETKPTAKHVPKAKRSTRIAQSATAALRLLLFTGCRLREILHLRWEHVDFERGCLFLPDSKSGRKTVILNAPALAVLNAMERVGPYVVPGEHPELARHDLKRPWDAVTKRAGLTGVRLHDLRHTYASFGAGGGLGLPIIGRLLGHAQRQPPHAMPTSITTAAARVRGDCRTHCRCAGRKPASKRLAASWTRLVA